MTILARDPLLRAVPTQTFNSTEEAAKFIRSLILDDNGSRALLPEQRIRNVLILNLYSAIENLASGALSGMWYPFVREEHEEGDFTYVLNFATHRTYDHKGERHWRKTRLHIYDPDRAALLATYEVNIPLSELD